MTKIKNSILGNIEFQKEKKFTVGNGNNLVVKRVSKTLFQLDIDDVLGSMPILGPVTFVSTKKGQLVFFPMISIKKLVYFGLPFSLLMFLYVQYENIENNIFIRCLIPLLFLLIFQIILMPFHVLITKRDLKKISKK